MIPSETRFRGKVWYLHSYFYGKKPKSVQKLVNELRKKGLSVHIVHKKPEIGEGKAGKTLVYWRHK